MGSKRLNLVTKMVIKKSKSKHKPPATRKNRRMLASKDERDRKVEIDKGNRNIQVQISP